MALQKSHLSEADIIRAVCLKKQFQSAYSAFANKDVLKTEAAIAELSNKDNRDLRKEQVKLAMKVWYAGSKFIKAQCQKGRIVDTLFYGTFAKATTLA